MSDLPDPGSRTWRCYLRFSVCGLIVVVVVVGLAVGWIVRSVRIQRESIAAIRKTHGSVSYDWQWRDGKALRGGRPSTPRWLVDLVGVDYFSHVTKVSYILSGLDAASAGVDASDERMLEPWMQSPVQRLKLDALTPSEFDAAMEHLKDFTELSDLSLRFTDITDAGLAHSKGLAKLSHLDLGFTRITDAGLVHLRGLTNLSDISIDHTPVTDSGLLHLKGMTKLARLDLGYTRVTGAGLVHLRTLANLSDLCLDHTSVTDSGLLHLKGLTSVSRLGLNGTRITDAGLVHLKGLTNLSSLDLIGTRVTDAGLMHLKGLTNLSEVYLYGSQASEEAIHGLKRALPRLQIYALPDFIRTVPRSRELPRQSPGNRSVDPRHQRVWPADRLI